MNVVSLSIVDLDKIKKLKNTNIHFVLGNVLELIQEENSFTEACRINICLSSAAVQRRWLLTTWSEVRVLPEAIETRCTVSLNLILEATRDVLVLSTNKTSTQIKECDFLCQTPSMLTREVMDFQDHDGFERSLERYFQWIRSVHGKDAEYVDEHIDGIKEWVEDAKKEGYTLKFTYI